MKAYRLFFLLPFLLLFSCCKDDDSPAKDAKPKDDLTQLPPETQEGKNTFGCLVNGQVWRNQGRGLDVTGQNLTASYSGLEKNLSFDAVKRIESLREIIAIHIIGEFTGKGNYKLDSNFQNDGKRIGMYSTSDGQNSCEYRTDYLNTGKLEITRFDSIPPYIVSGRFSFTVATPGCDTIRVTDGRFDIKYAY